MDWFLWGVVFGWGLCATWYYSQIEDGNEKVAAGAGIVFVGLGIVAVIISISLNRQHR